MKERSGGDTAEATPKQSLSVRPKGLTTQQMAQTRPKPSDTNTLSTEPSHDTPRTLKNGVKAHVFTEQDRIKGRQRSIEVRQERAKSHGQRVRELAEKKEKQLVAALITQALTGDVRALQTLWAYAYGTPAKVEPDELDVTVNSSEAPRAHDLAAVLKLAEAAGVDVTSSGIGNGNTTLDT